MNAAGGGTNIPTLGGYKTGGKVSDRPGVVTDPEEKARIEADTLYWVNKERTEYLGLPPLDKISYADGVELTKPMGKEFYGAGIKETSETDMNLFAIPGIRHKSITDEAMSTAEENFRCMYISDVELYVSGTYVTGTLGTNETLDFGTTITNFRNRSLSVNYFQ